MKVILIPCKRKKVHITHGNGSFRWGNCLGGRNLRSLFLLPPSSRSAVASVFGWATRSILGSLIGRCVSLGPPGSLTSVPSVSPGSAPGSPGWSSRSISTAEYPRSKSALWPLCRWGSCSIGVVGSVGLQTAESSSGRCSLGFVSFVCGPSMSVASRDEFRGTRCMLPAVSAAPVEGRTVSLSKSVHASTWIH